MNERMRMFSREDILRIKERAKRSPEYIEAIVKNTRYVRQKLYIQKSGLATWYHYFTCPHCGTRLSFNYYDSSAFSCPECGSVQTGEPYIGAWWENVLSMTTSAAYELAVGYIATEREDFLSVAKEIILGYAENYKNYEVHGGIPYNHPGRFAAQVLTDCVPICHLAGAYSLLYDFFTESERYIIENEMLRPAAEHQKKYMTPQLHNHEVAICASIGAIGLAINDVELVRFATDTKYGLKYQIDHAYLDDNFWFECSASYHLYALHWFMMFEKMARHTPYCLFRDGKYRDKLYSALVFPLKLRINPSSLACLNDGNGLLLGNHSIYEYAYSYFGTEDILTLLSSCYKDGNRKTLEDFIYGVDSLPDCTPTPLNNYISATGSGLAILHGSDERTLVFKATPYGGEHDHYDRLAISFGAFGNNACMDLGTASGYGSPLHYGYYKNTATHNTVVIDGKNMAPCDTRIREYRINARDDIYLDAETLPPEDYKMLDSFTIKQWSDKAYRGVKMRRIISWHDKYFIDVFSVESDNTLKKEWTWHVSAEAEIPKDAAFIGQIAKDGPQSYFTNAYLLEGQGIFKSTFRAADFNMDVHTLADGKKLIFAQGPDNPATGNVSYLLLRSEQTSPVFVNVIEAYPKEPEIRSVDITDTQGKISVVITDTTGEKRRFVFEL